MHRREALKLIEADMKTHNMKEVGFITDCRTYLTVTAKSEKGDFYRYIYDDLCKYVRRFHLTEQLSTEVYIGTVESEVR